MIEEYYAVVSAALLLYVATIWSPSGWFNLFAKAVFAVTALSGAVVIARAFGA